MNGKPMFEVQSDYEAPLLRLLDRLPGGQAETAEVLRRFEQEYGDRIPQAHRQNHGSHEPRWQNHLRWGRNYLRERGFLDAPKRGIWRITDEGRRWVAENPATNRLPPFKRSRTKLTTTGIIINAITIENYRSIRHLTFDLEPLTVLLGHNAAGKSNIVEAISFLTDVIRAGVERAVQTRGRESFDDLLYRGAATPVIRFKLELSVPAGDAEPPWELTYLLGLGPDPRSGQLQVREEYLGGKQIGSTDPATAFIELKSGTYQIWVCFK